MKLRKGDHPRLRHFESCQNNVNRLENKRQDEKSYT